MPRVDISCRECRSARRKLLPRRLRCPGRSRTRYQPARERLGCGSNPGQDRDLPRQHQERPPGLHTHGPPPLPAVGRTAVHRSGLARSRLTSTILQGEPRGNDRQGGHRDSRSNLSWNAHLLLLNRQPYVRRRRHDGSQRTPPPRRTSSPRRRRPNVAGAGVEESGAGGAHACVIRQEQAVRVGGRPGVHGRRRAPTQRRTWEQVVGVGGGGGNPMPRPCLSDAPAEIFAGSKAYDQLTASEAGATCRAPTLRQRGCGGHQGLNLVGAVRPPPRSP